MWAASPTSLRAGWASLQQLGLSSSQIAAVVQAHPALVTYNWAGEAKQRLLAWVQQQLGLSYYEFLLHHAGYVMFSVARTAMRADYLWQHRPDLYAETASRGPGPLLSLLTDARSFFPKAGCTKDEVAAFNRDWLATLAGRRWGSTALQVQRRRNNKAA